MVAAEAGVFAREPESSALAVDNHSGDYFFAFRICQLGVGGGREKKKGGGGTGSLFRTEPPPGGLAGAVGGFGGFVRCMTDLL